jgi:UPF0716 protein FxsA
MRFLLLIFILIPVVEIWLLIEIGGEIGTLATIGWLILAMILGVNLIRYQGVATMMNINQQLRRGEPPAQAMADGMLRGVAGILLVVPGFASDFMALLLLIPPIRRWMMARWLHNVRVKTARFRGNTYEAEPFSPPPTATQKIERAPSEKAGRTLEGEYEQQDQDKK